MVEKLGEDGELMHASEVLPEFAAKFEAVKPALQRFCRGE
jgi:hypothetical protein